VVGTSPGTRPRHCWASTRARDDLRVGLIKAIGATGGALLEETPLSAIRSLVWRAQNGADDDLGDVD
jgi:hypothetical protein